MTRRPVVLAWLLLAGGLAVVASAQPWWRAVGAGTGPATSVTFSGADATGGLSQALSLVVLVGALLALTLGVRGRQVLAVLLATAGTAAAVVGLLRLQPDAAAVRTRFRQISLVDTFALTGTPWPYVYGAAGLLVGLGAVLLIRASPGWPQRGRRFERAPAGNPRTAARASARLDPARHPDDAWRALDAGLDPTTEDAEADDAPGDPDVRIEDATDTMVEKRPGRQE